MTHKSTNPSRLFLRMVLETCLSLDVEETVDNLRAWLTPTEVRRLVDVAIATLDETKGVRSVGPPQPPLDCARAEATRWADDASLAERMAYMAAIWNRLPQPLQGAFISTATKDTI